MNLLSTASTAGGLGFTVIYIVVICAVMWFLLVRPQKKEQKRLDAMLAGLAVGYWKSKEDVIKNWTIDHTFEPEISEEQRARRIRGWNKAVRYAYGWAKEEEI